MADDTQEGVLGKYRGFDPGNTPADYYDLHSSGNPFGAAGAPPQDLSNTSDFPPPNPMLGTPFGYFTNPQITDTRNPYADGSGNPPANVTPLEQHIRGGFDADYTDLNLYQQGESLGGAAQGNARQSSGDPAAVWWDEGFDKSGEGRS